MNATMKEWLGFIVLALLFVALVVGVLSWQVPYAHP